MSSKRVYFDTEEIVLRKKKGWIEVDTDFIQVYKMASKATASFKLINSYRLLFYLIQKYEGSGIFEVGVQFLDGFNEYLSSGCSNAIKKSQLHNCMIELMEAKLAIKVRKGQYHLNPYLFWSESAADRIDMIKNIDEAGNKSLYHLTETSETIIAKEDAAKYLSAHK